MQCSSRYAFYLLSAFQLEQWKSIKTVFHFVSAFLIAELGFRYCCGTVLCFGISAITFVSLGFYRNAFITKLKFWPCLKFSFFWITKIVIVSWYFLPWSLSPANVVSCHCWPYRLQRSLLENRIAELTSQGLYLISDYLLGCVSVYA